VLDKLVLSVSEVSALYRYIATLHFSPRRANHPLVQTYPVWSVMHGHHEDITNVDFTLTEPSHRSGGQGRVAN
jgi:hypothetical protein